MGGGWWGYTGFPSGRLAVWPSWSSGRLEATWFLEHNSSLLWNFHFNFHMHVGFGHALKPVDFEQ